MTGREALNAAIADVKKKDAAFLEAEAALNTARSDFDLAGARRRASHELLQEIFRGVVERGEITG